MSVATVTVRETRKVRVCDRCGKAKSVDAKPLSITYGKEQAKAEGLPGDYCVCLRCKDVIVGKMKMTPRSTRRSDATKP